MDLVLVTGAGASRNLHAAGADPLPLMSDWARALCRKIGAGLAGMTGLAKAETGPDFEETLGALFEWLALEPVNRRFAAMTAQRASANADGYVQNFRTALDHARRHGDALTSALHESLFEEFGAPRIDRTKAAEGYDRLLSAVAAEHGRSPALVCATTNYDRSLELGLLTLGRRVRSGFTASTVLSQTLEPEGLGTFEQETPSILYLHGAVGWYRDAQGTIKAHPADSPFNPSLGVPAVLYPSLNKQIEQLETRQLWDEFSKALEKASHVLVLGHSLHDEHLVAQLARTSSSLAVSFRSRGKSAEAHKTAIEWIGEKLPAATPLAMDFGPEPKFDRAAMKKWIRA